MTFRALVVWCSVCGLVNGGCARDPYDLDLETKFMTAEVDYESDAPVAFSPELGDPISRALTSVQFDWGENHPMAVRYSLLAGVSAVNPCGSDSEPASACARPGHVISGLPFHLHELAHVAAFARGSPPRVFREGLAEVYGCTSVSPLASRELTIEQIFDAWTLPVASSRVS